MGNRIGKAIKIDEMTLLKARTLYARMCVEIDLNAPLLPSYIVDGNHLKIEYEGLHLICFHCGRMGHSLETCPAKRSKEGNSQNEEKGEEGNHHMEEDRGTVVEKSPEKFGEWMLVKDNRKGKRVNFQGSTSAQGQKKSDRPVREKAGTSRFEVLEVEEPSLSVENVQGKDREPLRNISNHVGGEAGGQGMNQRSKAKSVNEKQKEGKGGQHNGPRGTSEGIKELRGDVRVQLKGTSTETRNEAHTSILGRGETRVQTHTGGYKERISQRGPKGGGGHIDVKLALPSPVGSTGQRPLPEEPPDQDLESPGEMGCHSEDEHMEGVQEEPPGSGSKKVLMDTVDVEELLGAEEKFLDAVMGGEESMKEDSLSQ